MAKIDRDVVLKLASLSRLKLNDSEVDQFASEISEILDYVEQLQAVDVNGLEPTYQVTGLKNVSRADEILDYQAKPQDLLKNAPDREDDYFKVRRVL